MAGIVIDTHFPDSDECLEFCEMLDEPHGWVYLVNLWRWGMDKKRACGTIPRIIARVPTCVASRAEYAGSPELLWRALTEPFGPDEKPWLVEQEDGSFYMRGWSRTARWFKEQARLKKLSESRRVKRDHIKNAEDGVECESDCTQCYTQDGTRATHRAALGIKVKSKSKSKEKKGDSSLKEIKPVPLTDSPPPLDWSPGMPITDVSQLELLFSHYGVTVAMGSVEIATARRVIAAGPIDADECKFVFTERKCRSAKYFLTVVEGRRGEAQAESEKSSPAKPAPRVYARQAELDELNTLGGHHELTTIIKAEFETLISLMTVDRAKEHLALMFASDPDWAVAEFEPWRRVIEAELAAQGAS